MKITTLTTRVLMVISLLTLLPVTSAYAQTIHMRVHVPFQFLAGNGVLPAGEYRVEVDPAFNRTTLRLADGTAGMCLSAHPDQRPGPAVDRGVLVFHKYGNQHFLRRIWNGGGSLGYEIPETKAEREMARKAKTDAGIDVASLRVWQKQ